MADKERDISLDVLKGLAILLMVLGHVSTPLTNFIFSFHMPLFFFVSGYLYKERDFKTTIRRNFKKILVPYLVTGLIIWFVKIIIYHNWDWGISLLLSNGSAPVWHLDGYYVGPLWFLMCYFTSTIYFQFILNIKWDIVQLLLLLFLFVVSTFYKENFGLLPFNILNAIPATICLWVGYQLKLQSIRKVITSIPLMVGGGSLLDCLYRVWGVIDGFSFI